MKTQTVLKQTELREFRESLDISQSHLARETGISQSKISRYERGLRTASKGTMTLITNKLMALKGSLEEPLPELDEEVLKEAYPSPKKKSFGWILEASEAVVSWKKALEELQKIKDKKGDLKIVLNGVSQMMLDLHKFQDDQGEKLTGWEVCEDALKSFVKSLVSKDFLSLDFNRWMEERENDITVITSFITQDQMWIDMVLFSEKSKDVN